MEHQFKYFAFISYSSKDTEWGKKIQKKLEHYRMPATLCSEHGWERTPIKPVFFAPTDIQPGGLTEQTAANSDGVIDGHSTKPDANGYVSLTIPLAERKTEYPVSSSTPLVDKTISLPCGPDDVTIFK